jgi:hypothetical protein
MRLSLLLLLIGSLPLALRAQAPGLPVGQTHYSIVQASNGHSVGSAACNVASTPEGYLIGSSGTLTLSKFSYTFSNSNRLDPQLNIVSDDLTGTVNSSQVVFHMASDSTGRKFDVSIVASGKTTTNNFTRRRNTALLPDLDPAAYLAMVHFALAQAPYAWVVIPKQNGILVPANYRGDADVSGTFNGQSILVHHATVIVSATNGISVELYYSSDGSLFEADLPEQNFYVIRTGFHLLSRPQYTPPRGAAPPSAAQPGAQPGAQPNGQPGAQQP